MFEILLLLKTNHSINVSVVVTVQLVIIYLNDPPVNNVLSFFYTCTYICSSGPKMIPKSYFLSENLGCRLLAGGVQHEHIYVNEIATVCNIVAGSIQTNLDILEKGYLES